MYILTIGETERETLWVCFDSIEAGRQFLSLLPGYGCERNEENGSIEREWLRPSEFPDYGVIDFRGNKMPITRFMFQDGDEVAVYFREIPNLSVENQGLIDGATSVDAYSIPNEETRDYISTREKTFKVVKSILAGRGIETERAFHGSEDGEAILYKRPGDPDWHFLGHMDPAFVELGKESEERIREWVEESLL